MEVWATFITNLQLEHSYLLSMPQCEFASYRNKALLINTTHNTHMRHTTNFIDALIEGLKEPDAFPTASLQ